MAARFKDAVFAKRFPVLIEQEQRCKTDLDGNALKQSAHATVAFMGAGRCADCFVAIPPVNICMALHGYGCGGKAPRNGDDGRWPV